MVCILLSTYNGEKYIREQLDSILSQTGVDIRVLVRDDGSQDRTLSILQEYKERYPNEIIYEQGENVGFAMSFTILLRIGRKCFPTCRYFAFSDQDDVWCPQKIETAISYLKQESEELPVAYCSNLTLVDANLNYLREAWKKEKVCITKPRALVQSFATGCTMVFNRKALDMYIDNLPKDVKFHDFLMYQICVFLGKVIWDEKSYILYRQHANNQIGRPGYWSRWKRRLQGHYKEHTFEYMNRSFLEAFRSILDKSDVALIEKIVDYRKNLFTHLALLCNTKISYTNKEEDFFFRLKILCGTV